MTAIKPQMVSQPENPQSELDLWLKEAVAPAYDEILADPSRARPADRVLQALHSRSQKTVVPASSSVVPA